MKRLLLTGAGGFVGSHTLIHVLHNTDWEVVVLDSFRHKGLTDRIRQMVHESHPEYVERIKVFPHDLRVPISATLAAQMGRIDYIINMASESHVDRSIDEPRPFIENNVSLVLSMLEFTRERSAHAAECMGCFTKYGTVEKFLQVSTDEVYGPAARGHDHGEGEPHRPSNPYSASKAAQEDICFSYWRTYNTPIIISNTMNIIGELQDQEKYIPKAIKAVMEGTELTIHASASGEIGSRYYLHARNQADALLFMLQNVEPRRYGDTWSIPEGAIEGADIETSGIIDTPSHYHVVGEREVDNLELAQLIAKFAGKELKHKLVDFHSSRPGHDLRYALDGSRLSNLGWKAPVPFEESLQRTVEWTLAHPEWLL